jgi:hypothetical protein
MVGPPPPDDDELELLDDELLDDELLELEEELLELEDELEDELDEEELEDELDEELEFDPPLLLLPVPPHAPSAATVAHNRIKRARCVNVENGILFIMCYL